MKAGRAAMWIGAGAAVLLGIVALLLALAVLRPQWILPLVERWLAPEGGSATLAGLEITLFPPALGLEGLTVAGPGEEGDRLRLAVLQVEVDVRRLVGDGPWLRRVEAKDLVYERSRPRETAAVFDLTPLEWLFRIERLSLENGRVRMALPWGNLAVDGVNLSVLPGETGIRRFRAEGEISASRDGISVAGGTVVARGEAEPGPAIAAELTLRDARVDLPWIGGEIAGRAGLRLTRGGVRAEDLSLAMAAARLGTDAMGLPGRVPVRLDASGALALDGRRPSLEVRTFEVGDLLRARGKASGAALESLSGTVEGNVRRIERLKAVLASVADGRLKEVGLEGDLPFRAEVAVEGAKRTLALDLLPRDLRVSLPQVGLAGRLDGTVRAAGFLEKWKAGEAVLTGRLQGTGRLSRPPVSIRSARVDLPLAGGIAAPRLPGFRISAEEGEVSYEGRTLPLGALTVRGTAEVGGDSLRLDALEIRSLNVGRLTGGMAFRGGRFEGRLEGRNLEARSFPDLAAALSGRDGKDWTTEGTVDIEARLAPDGEGTRVAAEVTTTRIGFGSPAGDVLGQNLGGRLSLDSRLGPRSRAAAELEIAGGEVLWDTVYVDLARAPLALRARLGRTGPGRYEDIALEGDWADIGAVRLDGGFARKGEGWRHRGNLLLRAARLGPLFETLVRDPLAPSHPGLAGLAMEGTGHLDLSFSGSEKQTDLSGRLVLRVEDLRREGEPAVLSGLDVDLPISYALGGKDPGKPAPSADAGWGSLRLETLRLAGREIGPVAAPAALVPNRLYFGGGIDASLFGAKVEVRRIRVEEPLSPSFRAKLAVRVEGLDLARIPGDGLPLQGRLDGTLDPVSIGRDRLRAAGRLRGEFFGGGIEIDNVTVDRPFAPGREIGADAAFDRIHLEPLSTALGIGRITGRLSGSVRGLRIAYGQPVAFHLRMRSVPVEGVPQRVSLKAVNSISLLSTGSSLQGLGYSLMTTFFRQFRYAKMGIECGLENDVFTVRGLIREDGVEYLVKRPLLGGINVINRTPDNRISFSDMLERLKRVTAGDTLEEGRYFPPGGLPGRASDGRTFGRRALGDGEDPSRCTDTIGEKEGSCDESLLEPGVSPLRRFSSSWGASR